MADLAIVIPALNERDNIGDLLDDCARQEPAPDRVVVVDAGSDDGTAEYLRERSEQWPALEVVVRPGATPGAGRNAGIEHAQTAWVATLDAGSRIDPGWLGALVSAAGGSEARVSVGQAIPDAHSDFERATGWFTLRAFKPSAEAGPIGREFLPAGRSGYCFARATWKRAGGYPPELPWGEDKTMLRRMRAAGAEVVVAPEAVVRWRPRRTLAEFYSQYERYGRGDAMAGIDRQNELVPIAIYVAGALLAGRARTSPAARALLAAGIAGYLGIFVRAARRDLSLRDGLAWIPVLRVTADIAKMRGFLAASAGQAIARRRGG